MAKTPNISQPTGQGVGPPPSRPNDIQLVEIAKLQSDGEYIRRDLGEMQSDMCNLRDRMTRLEVRVDHLPSKGFIVTVVTISVFLGAIVTLAPKLQLVFGLVR